MALLLSRQLHKLIHEIIKLDSLPCSISTTYNFQPIDRKVQYNPIYGRKLKIGQNLKDNHIIKFKITKLNIRKNTIESDEMHEGNIDQQGNQHT